MKCWNNAEKQKTTANLNSPSKTWREKDSNVASSSAANRFGFFGQEINVFEHVQEIRNDQAHAEGLVSESNMEVCTEPQSGIDNVRLEDGVCDKVS